MDTTPVDAKPRRRRWVEHVLPLSSSVALHAGIIVLGVIAYRAAVDPAARPDREQVVVPQTASLSRPTNPGGLAHPGAALLDPMRDAGQVFDQHPVDVGFTAAPGQVPAGFGLGPAAAHAAFGRPAGGGIAPWGPPGGGDVGGRGIGSGRDVFQGDGKDVVYLCDASGSMVGVFGPLKQELRKSIAQLTVDENGANTFNVIFFNDGPPRVLFADGRHIATPAAKSAATAFIDDQVSTGGTDPMAAIRKALADRPDLLFVLTDGFDQVADLSAVADAFRRGNADGHAHVNCILLQTDAADPQLVATLKRIATEGHGTYKAIEKKDL